MMSDGFILCFWEYTSRSIPLLLSVDVSVELFDLEDKIIYYSKLYTVFESYMDT